MKHWTRRAAMQATLALLPVEFVGHVGSSRREAHEERGHYAAPGALSRMTFKSGSP